MDIFGIGQAVRGALEIYFRSARATGRTISMLDSVKDGDRICFSDSREADRVKRLCLERELDVECIVIPPSDPGRIFERGTSQGRTIFDHRWVEEYYLRTIDYAAKDLDHFEKESSGWGEAHRETQRAVMEINRWRL